MLPGAVLGKYQIVRPLGAGGMGAVYEAVHVDIGKPVALMGASPSRIGTARAQLHLRQLLSHVHARLLPPPELLIASAHERFDKSLRLTDEGTRDVLSKLLQRFSRWIARERAASDAERELATRAATRL